MYKASCRVPHQYKQEAVTMANYLVFDLDDYYIEIPDSMDFRVAIIGVSAPIQPDVLTFPASQSTGYMQRMGKGEAGQHEWVFRMYSQDTTTDTPPRLNRISFYVFNLGGAEGTGSYFQKPVQAQERIHLVGVADGERV
jgi:hypothetical protein